MMQLNDKKALEKIYVLICYRLKLNI